MPMSEVYQKALAITHLRCGSRTNLHRSAPEEKWGLDSFSSSQFKRWFAKCPVFFSQTPLREVFQLDAICSLNMLNSIRKTNGKVQQNTFSYGSFSEVYHKTNEQEGFGTRYELSSIPGHAIRYKARQIQISCGIWLRSVSLTEFSSRSGRNMSNSFRSFKIFTM